MKKRTKENPKLTKGVPSAVVLSILIHAGLFLLAGMLVVFTVVKKEEQKFEPPKAVERPKMKLKKPKVKVKKTSKPKPTTRIVTKVNRASMPDIQLPEMSGLADGLSGGVGGFDLMPDLGGVTLFGSGQSIGSDFEGVYYDTKLNRQGKKLNNTDTGGDPWRAVIYKFLKRGWDPSVFSRYYRSPKKLYATNFVVPLTLSSVAPDSFGDKISIGALWMAHYKGQLVSTEAITFRFWGMGDEFLVVRVGGELVLALDWPHPGYEGKIIGNLWKSTSSQSRKYIMGNNRTEVGDWITLEPGESLPMEVLIGDNGGLAAFYLAVEVKGVKYEHNRQNGPILPAFKTAEMSHDLLDILYRELPEGEIALTNGPVFCDYDTSVKVLPAVEPEASEPEVPEDTDENKIRTWTFLDGRTLEAELINTFGGKVVLKGSRRKTYKILMDNLSAKDIEYTELADPPAFDVDLINLLKQVRYNGGFYDIQYWGRPPEKRGTFGVRLKQTSAGDYNHELQVELFVVGQERSGDKYILLDHQKTAFTPSQEEQRTFEFQSQREVVLTNVEIIDWVRGEKYLGYLVVVTDARGEVIMRKTSKKWLSENVENLRQLSVGNYMDKTCTRSYPSRPKTLLY